MQVKSLPRQSSLHEALEVGCNTLEDMYQKLTGYTTIGAAINADDLATLMANSQKTIDELNPFCLQAKGIISSMSRPKRGRKKKGDDAESLDGEPLDDA